MARLMMTSCSNPAIPWVDSYLPDLAERLADLGHELDASGLRGLGEPGVYRWDPARRAGLVNRAFADPDVDAVVDVSGGDLANEVLPHLDWQTIADNPKPMLGFSDLSCVLNAIVARTGRPALLWNATAGLRRGFDALELALAGGVVRPELTPDRGLGSLKWLGGNMRCFLKLAGTPYWPDFTGRVLLLESKGGDLRALAAGLAHHAQLGTFERAAGMVVGQLTEIDGEGERSRALGLVGEYAGGLPVEQAPGLGHSSDTQAATLG